MLKVKDNTAYSIRDIIVREIVNALTLQHNAELNAESRIHEYRKTIKRCRSLLRLLKQCMSEYDFEKLDQKLAATAGDMAIRRDATVNLRTFLHLAQFHTEFLNKNLINKIVDDLTQDLRHAYETVSSDPVKTETSLITNLTSVLADLKTISLLPVTRQDFIKAIEQSHYKAAKWYIDSRNTLETEIIHKWRKFTKHFLLQLKFTPGIDKILMGTLISKLDNVCELLGKDHDLAVLENRLKASAGITKEDFQKIHLVIVKERAKLQKESFHVGEDIFSENQVRNFRLHSYA